MPRLPVAVVGVGHLGKEHARILSTMPETQLVGVVDPNRVQAEAVAGRCQSRAYADHREILGQVRAAVIAAPTCHHHAVARDFLDRGIPLLIEKPLAGTAEQARDLVRCADAGGTLVQVGHVERFNPAFEELQRRNIAPRYVVCERYSGFSGRSTDVGVVLDVMIHDIDLLLTLVDSPVSRVEAMGVAVLGGHEDMVQARVRFANGCVADLTASRVQPEPLRRMRLWGAEGFAGVDFAKRQVSLMQPAEHLRGYRLDSRKLDAATANSLKTELFGRHIQTSLVDCSDHCQADQLTRELQEFVHCVRDGGKPRVSGAAGAAALELAARILEAAQGHLWEPGCAGPNQIPAPLGWLFPPDLGNLPQAA